MRLTYIYRSRGKATRFWDISGAKVALGCFEFAAFQIRTGLYDNKKNHSCWLGHRKYLGVYSQSKVAAAISSEKSQLVPPVAAPSSAKLSSLVAEPATGCSDLRLLLDHSITAVSTD